MACTQGLEDLSHGMKMKGFIDRAVRDKTKQWTVLCDLSLLRYKSSI